MSTDQRIRQAPPGVLERLRALDTCIVSNAIERLDVRLRNEGFTDISVRCLTPSLPPMVGYAATGRFAQQQLPRRGIGTMIVWIGRNTGRPSRRRA